MPSTTPKERLLEAVADVALAGGIADRSLRAIAEAAGTSHRMLIHHFGSREGLLVDVIRAVEARQRDALSKLVAESTEVPEELADRFWKHLRSPELGPQERLFFEVYGQALQGRRWAKPLLEGVVEDWVGPVAAMLTAEGISPDTARIVARLYIAVGRGLLLDVLATGDAHEVDTAMQYFSEMLLAHLPPRHDHVLAAGWIWLENLRVFLELTSHYVSYSFDDSDWQAVRTGLEAPHAEADTYSYPIIGQAQLNIALTKNPGGDEVTLKITSQPDQRLATRITTLMDAFSS
jgi:AcrR family transcriptional regulator